jgi:hypothetical protein
MSEIKSKKMSVRHKLGQFYTTNYEHILQNMCIPNNITNIIEPFAGNGDLLNFINNKENYRIECYDIEPKQDYIIEKDTLINPPDYDNKFILTNPPYLARNKNADKLIYDKYKCNDLYKCFIINVINSNCIGGIIIIPLNFICSIRKNDIELRQKFIEKYKILVINIFEEQVFEDTSYTVCCLQFEQKNNIDILQYNIRCFIYPSNKIMEILLTPENNYTIGGEIYNLPKNINYKIERATRLTKDIDCNITNILLKCIDDSITNKIQLKIIDDTAKYIDNTPKCSGRSYAVLVIKPAINLERQLLLVRNFNEYLEKHRGEYNSLFLSNYRESNTIARKRISFELAFHLCSYLL